ncbi:MAG: MGMT family protein [Proteobacteria bacterium]|nr:MGMT family protein [Pseudomonadota bacterium]MBW3617432.1 MGMT family protein [Pseudomonadota bacterium]
MTDAQVKADVLALASAVPAGRVVTYRAMAGWLEVSPRQVAYLLGQLTPEEADATPWHRVVGDEGWLGAVKVDSSGRSQEERLVQEGVAVAEGRVSDFEAVQVAVGELNSGVRRGDAVQAAADGREP